MSGQESVIIGVDPRKISATIEVVDSHKRLLGGGRFDTNQAGYAAMRRYVKQWQDRLSRHTATASGVASSSSSRAL